MKTYLKISLTFFAALSTSDSAHADQITDIIKKSSNRSWKTSNMPKKKSDTPDVKPIRYVNVTYYVDKYWNEKISDNNFEQKSESVCQKTISMPMYDTTSDSSGAENWFDSCETTLDSLDLGKTYKVKIKLGGFLLLNTKDNTKDFHPEVDIRLHPKTSERVGILTGWVYGQFDEITTQMHDFSQTFYQGQKIFVSAYLQDSNKH